MPAIPPVPLKILIVDDERPIRRFLNATLGSRYKILEAENGKDAKWHIGLQTWMGTGFDKVT